MSWEIDEQPKVQSREEEAEDYNIEVPTSLPNEEAKTDGEYAHCETESKSPDTRSKWGRAQDLLEAKWYKVCNRYHNEATAEADDEGCGIRFCAEMR